MSSVQILSSTYRDGVEWRTSDLEGDAPHVILRNLNYGGNPLEKTTTLHSVRVNLDAVEFAEFVLVPPAAAVRGLDRAIAWHCRVRGSSANTCPLRKANERQIASRRRTFITGQNRAPLTNIDSPSDYVAWTFLRSANSFLAKCDEFQAFRKMTANNTGNPHTNYDGSILPVGYRNQLKILNIKDFYTVKVVLCGVLLFAHYSLR